MTESQVHTTNEHASVTTVSAEDSASVTPFQSLSLTVLAVLLSVIITGGISGSLSVSGLITILSILISGIIINLILIIR